jgi:hypothetical protein
VCDWYWEWLVKLAGSLLLCSPRSDIPSAKYCAHDHAARSHYSNCHGGRARGQLTKPRPQNPTASHSEAKARYDKRVEVVSGRERVRGPEYRGKKRALSRPHRCPSQDFHSRPLVSMTLPSVAWSRRPFHPIRYRCALGPTGLSSRLVSLWRLQSVVAFDNRDSAISSFLFVNS